MATTFSPTNISKMEPSAAPVVHSGVTNDTKVSKSRSTTPKEGKKTPKQSPAAVRGRSKTPSKKGPDALVLDANMESALS